MNRLREDKVLGMPREIVALPRLLQARIAQLSTIGSPGPQFDIVTPSLFVLSFSNHEVGGGGVRPKG